MLGAGPFTTLLRIDLRTPAAGPLGLQRHHLVVKAEHLKRNGAFPSESTPAAIAASSHQEPANRINRQEDTSSACTAPC